MNTTHAFSPTSLRGLPIRLAQKCRDPKSFPSNGQFSLPVILTSCTDADLAWSATNPFMLSYRWLDERSTCVVSDGLRTSLPVLSLKRGVDLEVEVVGETLPLAGRFTLQVSLVLEGVHWACDLLSDAWCDVQVELTPPRYWPGALNASRGGRAIRGAIAAAQISRRLAGNNFVLDVSPKVDPPNGIIAAGTAQVGEFMVGDEMRYVVSPWQCERPKETAPLTVSAPASVTVDELLEYASRQAQRVSELLAVIAEKDQQLRDLNHRYMSQLAAKHRRGAEQAPNGTDCEMTEPGTRRDDHLK